MTERYFLEWRTFLPGDLLVGGGFAFRLLDLFVAGLVLVALLLVLISTIVWVVVRLDALTRFVRSQAEGECLCESPSEHACQSCRAWEFLQVLAGPRGSYE